MYFMLNIWINISDIMLEVDTNIANLTVYEYCNNIRNGFI